MKTHTLTRCISEVSSTYPFEEVYSYCVGLACIFTDLPVVGQRKRMLRCLQVKYPNLTPFSRLSLTLLTTTQS